MTSPRQVPIFDGHNDVLLRLYRRGGTDAPRAFLEGDAKGHLDLPMARQGGFAGGLFAIFVPSTDRAIGPMAKHLLKTSVTAPCRHLPLN
jgi:membrane dipeptidase